MKISIYTLVVFILAAVTLMIMLGISAIFGQTVSDDIQACAANVGIRAGLVNSNSPADAGLDGCVTEQKEFTGTQEQIRNQYKMAYARCKTMFGPARTQRLLRSDATYCFVCGTYDVPEYTEVTDVISGENQDVSLYALLNRDEPVTQNLDTTGQTAVLFVQIVNFDGNFIQDWLQPLLSRSAVAGFVFGGSADVTSTIVISPYNQQLIEQYGCTTVTPKTT